MKWKSIISIVIILLAGCAKPEWELEIAGAMSARVYPFNGAEDISSSTGVFVSFTEPIGVESLKSGFQLASVSATADGSLEISADGKVARFTPTVPLQPSAEYKIVLSGVKTESGKDLALPQDGVISAFKTGGGNIRAGDGLSVISISPLATGFYDFSTLRIAFSESVVRSTVIAGDTFKFTRLGTAEQVAGTLIVRGSRLIFDPDSDLVPGEEYAIELTSGIKDQNGESLTPVSISIFPKSTGPRIPLVLQLSPDIATNVNPASLPFSNLMGIYSNSVEIDSKLIGRQSTYTSGILAAEMSDLETHIDIVPAVIRKGQRITASNIDIKLGGEIDSLLSSGEISLTLLSDVNVIITGNPLKDYNKDLPAVVYIELDASVTASDPRVNSILNQDILDVKLYGEVSSEGDSLIINAGGTTELDVLGAEKAPAALSLLIATVNASLPTDTTLPYVSSTYPIDTEDNIAVNASVAVVFSEPVKESTLAGRIRLTEGATPVAGSIRVEGSSVIFKPASMLLQNTVYTINVDAGIEDLAGNASIAGSSANFTTEALNSDANKAMIVSSMSVGVPCVLINANGTAPGDAGECRDSDDDVKKFSKFVLPSSKNIEVYFSEPVKSVSVTATSFVVKDKSTGLDVVGSRIVGYKSVTFVPNNPWVVGTEYELKLVGGTNNICNAGELCGVDELPLNTDILDDGAETEGGAGDIVIPFKGGAGTADPGLGLSLIRFTDANSNGIADATAPAETLYSENSVTLRNTSGGIYDSTYLLGTLLSVVKGYDYGSQTMPLEVGPGNWIFGTNADVLVLSTERVIIRPTGVASGAIRSPGGTDPDQRPVIDLALEAWMNAVNDSADAALQNTPVNIILSGRVDFLDDGRMVAVLSNINIVDVDALGGTITIRIEPGDAKVRALTTPVKQ